VTAKKPAAAQEPAETPAPKFAANPLYATPTTVAECQADYQANAELRDKFDATAKRQHRR